MSDYQFPDQFAVKCGLSEEEVQAFEEQNVIHGITKNGQRYYSAKDCYRLGGILHLMRGKGLRLVEAEAMVDRLVEPGLRSGSAAK